MLDAAFGDYRDVVRRFAEHGAFLIRANPEERYGVEGRGATRALEPGFIPIARPPRIVVVSYYPNAETLNIVEYAAMKERFDKWGETGAVGDYGAAYQDFLTAMPHWPFYKKWMEQIIEAVDVGCDELAWLPLVKLPRASDNKPTEDMMRTDREELKKQLAMLPPSIAWVQSAEVYGSAGGTVKSASRTVVVQKIPQRQRSSTSPDTPTIIKALRKALRDSL